MTKYYIDTSIWIDYYENRNDKYLPLGEWALALFAKIKENKDTIIISEMIIHELEILNRKEILKPFEKVIEKTEITQKQYTEAKQISAEREIPFGDALHAIISRDTQSILVTRDKHFQEIKQINKPYKPEELI